MNYEDLIPVINNEYKWELTSDKNVVVYVINKGFFSDMISVPPYPINRTWTGEFRLQWQNR